jgi:hypothetical protein
MRRRHVLGTFLVALIAAVTSVACGPQPPSLISSPDTPTPISAPVIEATSTTTTTTTTVLSTSRGPQIQLTEPPPAPSPVDYVNSLPYCWQCPEPAMEAFRVVAASVCTVHPLVRCWTPEEINLAANFVQRIMAGESAFCWNSRAWSHDTYLEMPCTESAHQGTHEDVGFGQITNVLRTPTSTLCRDLGQCRPEDTIASPWNSMVAYVVVLDELHTRPWCFYYSPGNPSFHLTNGDCDTWNP